MNVGNSLGREVGKGVQEAVDRKIAKKAEELIAKEEKSLYYVSDLLPFTGLFVIFLVLCSIIMLILLYSGLAYNEPGDRELILSLCAVCFGMAVIYAIWFVIVFKYKVTMTDTGVVEQTIWGRREISYEEIQEGAKRRPVSKTRLHYRFSLKGKDLILNRPMTYIGDDFARKLAKRAEVDLPE